MKILDYLRTLPQYALPQKTLSMLMGKLAQCTTPWIKKMLIRQFIKKYQVDMQLAEIEDIRQYTHFNDFFTRRLKPAVRPVAIAPLVSPVDGIISHMGYCTPAASIVAKGHGFSLAALLALEEAQCAPFIGGQYMTLYLSPRDYHRVHMPITGTLEAMTYIPGRLFSVQPTTVRVIPDLFSKNERLVAFFQTSAGPIAIVLVGAMIVGSIRTTWEGIIPRAPHILRKTYDTREHTLTQGEEMGAFQLGSTVIIILPHNWPCRWLAGIQPGKSVQFGEALSQ